ncbi:MAG: SDR family NAD(P)-dependent oxidoreductase [Acidimicrobiia bacterium]
MGERRPERARSAEAGATRPGGECAGRVAIVTGASRGIGAAIALRLAAEGAAVALVGRTAGPDSGAIPGSLAETAAHIDAVGGRSHAIVADLSDPALDRAAIVADARDALGEIDILVNNAAACFYLPYEHVSNRRYAVMFEVNVHAPWDLSRAVLPGMCARGHGAILNISSVVSAHPPGPPFPTFHAEHGATLYGASKAALERLTSGLAAEVYTRGVAVNAVSPVAAVATPGVEAMGLLPEDPRHVEPMEQMAEAALALCTVAPDRMTGRALTSAAVLAELGRTVRTLDGSALLHR